MPETGGKSMKKILFSAVLCLLLTLTALCQSTNQSMVCTYNDSDKTLNLNIYVSHGDAIVGYCSFDYDADVLCLIDSSKNPVPAVVPNQNASGDIYLKDVIQSNGGIVVTDVSKGTDKLVNTTDGYVLFAWYLPKSSDKIDASEGKVLIARISFKLNDGKTFNDITSSSITLAGKDITDKIGNWYEGLLVMNSAHKQFSTASGTMDKEIKYEFDFSQDTEQPTDSDDATPPESSDDQSPDATETPDTNNADTDTEQPTPDQEQPTPDQEQPSDSDTTTDDTEKTDDSDLPSGTEQGDESETFIGKADFDVSFSQSENSVRIRWNQPETERAVLGYDITISDKYGNVFKTIDDISPITNSFTLRDIGGGFELNVIIRAYLSDGYSLQSQTLATSTLDISKNTELIAFDITYDVAGGYLFGFDNEKVLFGECPTKAPIVVTDPRHTFAGWSTDGKNPVDLTNTRIYNNTEFSAVIKSKITSFMNGYDDGTFRPQGNITRAEISALASRVSGIYDAEQTYESDFTDTKTDAWYYNYVGFCTQNGIINGYDDGTFAPAKCVTRAEFAAITARLFGFEESDAQNVFADTQGHWAQGYISALYENGVIDTNETYEFYPNEYITRADAATILNASLGVSPDKAAIDAYIENNGNPYSDVSQSQAFYYDVLSAVLGL